MEQFLPWLRQVAFFQGLPDGDVMALATRMGRQRLIAGEFLCRAGDPPGCCWFVARGSLEVLSQGGRKMVEVQEGGAFGLPGLLSDVPRQVSACALEETWVFRLDRSAWDEIQEQGGGPALSLASRVARLLAAQLRQVDAVLDRLEERRQAAPAQKAVAATGEGGAGPREPAALRLPTRTPRPMSESRLEGWLAEVADHEGVDLRRVRAVPSAEKPIRPGGPLR